MSRDELLASLQSERYDNRWWSAPPKVVDNSEITTARRRRAALDELQEASARSQQERWRADVRRIRRSA